MAAKRKTTARRSPGASRKATKTGTASQKGGFPCPDCDFVAKHAMGLGRHRSTRHGAVSKRATRQKAAPAMVSDGSWLSRQDAAARAGVHYNTIRQWEQQGLLGTTKRPGKRGNLLSAADLDRVLSERSGGAAVATSAVVAPTGSANLSRVVAEFARSLEALLTELRGAGAQTASAGPRRRGRPPGSKNKPKAAATDGAPKRRGRPPGSKNKPKSVAAAAAPKRRGRPPGSKNKPKATAKRAAVAKRGKRGSAKRAAPKRAGRRASR